MAANALDGAMILIGTPAAVVLKLPLQQPDLSFAADQSHSRQRTYRYRMTLVKAHLDACLKSAIGRQHQEGWRFEGVLRRQQYAAVVDATLQG